MLPLIRLLVLTCLFGIVSQWGWILISRGIGVYGLSTDVVPLDESNSNSPLVIENGRSGRNLFEGACNIGDGSGSKIFMGKNAPEGRFPYVVALMDDWMRIQCTGIVINKEFVLTAAHCVDGPNWSLEKGGLVCLGNCSPRDKDTKIVESQILRFTKIILHPNYTATAEPSQQNDPWDIALLKLQHQIAIDPPTILEAKRWPKTNYSGHAGQRLIALGWGVNGGKVQVDSLQMTEKIEFLSTNKCREWYPDIMDHQGCIHVPGSFGGACEGDSGGPILIPDANDKSRLSGYAKLDQLVGLISYGMSCEQLDSITVYIQLRYFQNWIEATIKDNYDGNTCNLEAKKDNSMNKTQENEKGTHWKFSIGGWKLLIVPIFIIAVGVFILSVGPRAVTLFHHFCGQIISGNQSAGPSQDIGGEQPIVEDSAMALADRGQMPDRFSSFIKEGIASFRNEMSSFRRIVEDWPFWKCLNPKNEISNVEPGSLISRLTRMARNILTLVGEQDFESAFHETEKLFNEAIKLVSRETQNDQTTSESILPVVILYNSIMEFESLYEVTSCFHIMCKTYRLLVEILWYQCVRREIAGVEKPLIPLNVCKGIISNTKNGIRSLPKKGKVDTKFELQCAEQVANCLPSSSNAWCVNTDCTPHQLGPLDAMEKCKSFLCKAQHIHGNRVARWYLEVQYLHHLGMSIESDEQYRHYISPRIEDFLKKGDAHAVCLVVVLMSIIQTSRDFRMRKRAFEGSENTPGLCKILDWASCGLFCKDRLKDARCLVVDCLWKLASGSGDKYFVKRSLAVLEARYKKVERRMKPFYRDWLRWELDRLKNGNCFPVDTTCVQLQLARRVK